MLKYLSQYTHRVAISNHRLISLTEGKVTFRWKEYRDGGQHKLMTLTPDEFLRRFLLHTLPAGFVRIRFFGFMSNRRRAALLRMCKQLLETNPQQQVAPPSDTSIINNGSTWRCPLCGGPTIVIERLTARQIFVEIDTS